MRISAAQRQETEERIRRSIDELLGEDIPADGRCDITTLARHAGVDRTSFYGARPYVHLRKLFEQRLDALQQQGEHPDPRDAQIRRLEATVDALRQRIARHEQTTSELAAFRQQALSRLAAQHDEITRLRAALERASNVRRLPTAHS